MVHICGSVPKAWLVIVEGGNRWRVFREESGTARLSGVFPNEGKTVDIKMRVGRCWRFEGSSLAATAVPLPRPEAGGEGQHVGERVVTHLHHS